MLRRNKPRSGFLLGLRVGKADRTYILEYQDCAVPLKTLVFQHHSVVVNLSSKRIGEPEIHYAYRNE
jgi:hypothetical protein